MRLFSIVITILVLISYPSISNFSTTEFFHVNPHPHLMGKTRLKAIGSTVQPVDVTTSLWPTYSSWLVSGCALLPYRMLSRCYGFCSVTAAVSFLPGLPAGTGIKGKARLVDLFVTAGIPPCSTGELVDFRFENI